MDWEKFASIKPCNAYSIFCGVLDYRGTILKEIQSGDMHGFKNWEVHVNPDHISSEKIIKGFNRFYYESFVNSIFQDYKTPAKKQYHADFAEQTVRLSNKIDTTFPVTIKQGDSNLVFNIKFEYLDLFFFPHEIVFYCFKCDLRGFSFDEITLINSYLRNSGVTEETKFLYNQLSFLEPNRHKPNTNSLSFGNKLKVFSIIEYDEEISKEDENMLLYDLGICAKVGSAAGVNPFFQPSEEYLRELIEENRISVFNNWSALTLFDTFTGLFKKGALNNFVWENGYFNLLYIQSLFVKYYLFKINKIFYSKPKKHRELEDEFFEFNNYYNPSHISYNFLPSLIFKKIRYSLDIDSELKLLKEGIERAIQRTKVKNEKKTNFLLTVIAALAVFAVVWDVSDYINKLFSGTTTSYNIISGSLTAIVVIFLSIFFIRKYRKES